MALSTPRLVLLVFGVLLVVCGISVGVSEAFKHDRTTTTTINRHIERVVVRAGTGKVHLEGSESQRVMVREQLQWLWRRPVIMSEAEKSSSWRSRRFRSNNSPRFRWQKKYE